MTGHIKTKAFFLVLFFVLVWIVVLAPAHVIARLLPGNAPLVLQGITGGVWSGAVAQAALIADGQILTQGSMSWRVRPLSLLRVSPCVDIRFDESDITATRMASPAGTINGLACLYPGGQLTLRDVAFDLPAQRFLRSPEIRLGGEISGVVSTLAWESGALIELRGQGLWSNAAILSDGVNLPLKTLPFNVRRESGSSLIVQMDNGDLLAQQADTPLHISLQSTVALDGRFHTRAQLATQLQTPDDMIELLNVLAEPQGAGVFLLEMRSQP